MSDLILTSEQLYNMHVNYVNIRLLVQETREFHKLHDEANKTLKKSNDLLGSCEISEDVKRLYACRYIERVLLYFVEHYAERFVRYSTLYSYVEKAFSSLSVAVRFSLGEIDRERASAEQSSLSEAVELLATFPLRRVHWSALFRILVSISTAMASHVSSVPKGESPPEALAGFAAPLQALVAMVLMRNEIERGYNYARADSLEIAMPDDLWFDERYEQFRILMELARREQARGRSLLLGELNKRSYTLSILRPAQEAWGEVLFEGVT